MNYRNRIVGKMLKNKHLKIGYPQKSLIFAVYTAQIMLYK